MQKVLRKRAFISLFTILFILIFTSNLIQHKPQSTNDFLIINQVKTEKYNQILNIQQIIKNTLKLSQDDVDKENVNKNLLNYFSKNKLFNFYIQDNITKTKYSINQLNLDLISKVIIIKPTEYTTYKKYTITNGISKNLLLCMNYQSNNYLSIYCFPKNYSVQVITN